LRYGYYLLLLCLFGVQECFALHSKLSQGAAPQWAHRESYADAAPKLTKYISEGYIYLLSDRQTDVVSQTNYYHYVRKVLSEAGVQNASEINVDFNPAYEKLIFHSISVYRNGQKINKLQFGKFQTIQRESELDRFIYDGTLSAVLFLEDIRSGDIIDYEFSYVGFNPLFQGKFFTTHSTDFDQPVGRLTYTLHLPATRPLYIKNFRTGLKPHITIQGAERVYYWEANDLLPTHTEDYLPDGFDSYGEIQMTEFASWKEEKAWEKGLFRYNGTGSPELRAKIEEIRKSASTPEGRYLKAVHFVQDEIRYMGIELGENAHLPTVPEVVFKRRFGDCKDKSLLLCFMLRSLGIEAHPALVHSNYKEILQTWLPMPTAFNHCIVNARLNGRTLWIDPTSSHQRASSPDSLAHPAYGAALVVTDASEGLTTIPVAKSGSVFVKEIFHIKDTSTPVSFEVQTIYRGERADKTRYDFAQGSLHDLEKNCLSYYAGVYKNIEQAAPIQVEDDETHNLITLRELYTIKSFWKSLDSTKPDLKTCNFDARLIYDYLVKPKDGNRKLPYGINHPTHFTYHIEVNIPLSGINEEEITIDDKSFHFSYKAQSEENKLLLFYEYQSLKDRVEPQELARFIENIDKAIKTTDYGLDWKGPESTPHGIYWPMLLAMLAVAGVCSYIAFRFYNRDFNFHPSRLPGESIGSWLYLPGLGIMITPFALLYTIYANQSVSAATWDYLNNPPAGEDYSLWKLALVLEMILNMMLLTLSVLVAVLFVKRRSSLPAFLIALLLLTVFVQLMEQIFIVWLPTLAEEDKSGAAKRLVRSIFSALLWIPIFRASQKVKDTFVMSRRRYLVQPVEDLVSEEQIEGPLV
jgi:hypothetical protein